jgi:hypothetical protein
VHMIGGDRVFEYLDTESLAGLAEPGHEPVAVMSKLQQEVLLVATMGYVSDAAGDVMPIGSCHSSSSAGI